MKVSWSRRPTRRCHSAPPARFHLVAGRVAGRSRPARVGATDLQNTYLHLVRRDASTHENGVRLWRRRRDDDNPRFREHRLFLPRPQGAPTLGSPKAVLLPGLLGLATRILEYRETYLNCGKYVFLAPRWTARPLTNLSSGIHLLHRPTKAALNMPPAAGQKRSCKINRAMHGSAPIRRSFGVLR
jgi:hypothetical protein